MSKLNDTWYRAFPFLKKRNASVRDRSKNKTTQYSLSEDAIPKLLLVFVGPAVLGLIINVLYNVVDRIFVGQYVGAEGLSAVTMVFPINLFQFAFVLLFGSGAGVLIAKYLGESEPEKAQDVFGNMIAGLLIITTILTTVGFLFYKQLLSAFGAEGELLRLSSEYLFVILMGFPISFFLALSFTCRAEGNPSLPAKLVLLSAIINLSLDYVFMKLFNLGIRGAALATIIAQATNVLLLMRYYISDNSLVKLVWNKIRIRKNITLSILSVGFAPFVMDFAVSIQNVLVNSLLLKSGGTDAVAAMGILFGVNTIFMMTALGTGDGMQPIISYNFGAKLYNRALKTLIYVLKFVSIVALLGIVILNVFTTQIISVFIDGNVNIVQISEVALKIFSISIPFFMVQIVIARYFQALQKNKTATFLAILRPIILFIPIVYILENTYGLVGIWIAFVVSDSVAALIALFLVKKYTLHKSKKEIALQLELEQ